MQCDILCLDKIPEEYYKLFFGDSGNLLRLDKHFLRLLTAVTG